MDKAKFNICWISILVIFVGTIVYPVMLQNANYLRMTFNRTVYVKPAPEIKVIEDTKVETPAPTQKPVAKAAFSRDLKMGDRGEDVKRLQEYLNSQGFLISETGVGSLGHETELFGAGTKAALIKFQEHYANILLKPYGLTEGTGYFGSATRDLINS